ncbi:YbhN family protein, partial [Corynebacterium sp. S5S1]|uniref:lysylphosphatidylglycerol synthase transmembrane domain-containing protein n=1 Tax=Corynebacterium sp. S5S1 TaxID=1881620 RepID=UPI00338F0E79
MSDGFRTLRHAQPWPIVVVFITFAFSLLAMAEVMRKLFVAGGVPVSFKECNNIVFASNAWSTTLPGGPAFAAILTYKVQRAWGASVVLCGWFFVLSSAISTLWVVLIGFTGVFFWGWASCNTRTVGRWIKNLPWKKTDKLVKHVNKLDQVSLNLGQFSWVTLMAFFNRAFDAVALWACAWAVTGNMPSFWPADDHTTIMGISVAFITAKLAGSAQITPAGVGTVEIAIITALVATGMTAVDATGTVLVYRLITFVFYSAIGWVIYFAYYARKG